MGNSCACDSTCTKPADDVVVADRCTPAFPPLGWAPAQEPQVSERVSFHLDSSKNSDSLQSPTTATSIEARSLSEEDEALDEQGVDISKGEEALQALEEAFQAVRTLVRQGRVFDAGVALLSLEEDLRTPRSPAKRLDGGSRYQEFSDRFQKDRLIVKLREVSARMTKTVAQICAPQALPCGPEDKRWAQVKCDDPKIHPNFGGEILIRLAEGSERDPKGPSTQIIACGFLDSYPLDIARFVSVYRETDLYRKEWAADCEKCEGEVGDAEMLYGCLSRFINSSPIMPVKFDIITVREFAVCTKSPIPGRGPGVLVSDFSPPADSKFFQGWKIPDTYKRSVRVSGIETVLYFTPRLDDPSQVDIFAFAKAAVPIPQWLLPLSLLKRFFANHFLTLFSCLKTCVADHWGKWEYQDRIAANHELYQAISNLKAPTLTERKAVEGATTEGAAPREVG